MLATTAKRKVMIDNQEGTEYEATVALLRIDELGAEDKTTFRVIFQGKTSTKDRTAHAIIKAAQIGKPISAAEI